LQHAHPKRPIDGTFCFQTFEQLFGLSREDLRLVRILIREIECPTSVLSRWRGTNDNPPRTASNCDMSDVGSVLKKQTWINLLLDHALRVRIC
jgi:hypothetical protein